MAEAKKQTYSMYGKDYDFEDLQRRADAGLNQYISTLKRGYKDQDKFRQAYYNLMSGIQDGTITFQNGQYIDSTGRYTNSENKKKDYYGLMANYIYNQQKRGKLYTPPEDDSKIKWGTHTLANQIKLGLLGNSDNAQDFLDQDEVVNNVRGNTNRIKALQTVFTDLRDNFDSKFTGYSDKQKEEAMQYLNGAITALSDNKADNKDWLALNRIGGIDFRALLSTAGPTQDIKVEIPMGMTAQEYDEFKKLPEQEQQLRTDLYNQEQEKARREAHNNQVKTYQNNLWSTYLSANPSIADFTQVQTNATYNTLNNTPHRNWSTIGNAFIQAIKQGRYRGADETTELVSFQNRGISLSQYMSAMYNTFKKYPNAINNFAKLQHDSKGNKVYQIRNSKNQKGEWLYMVPITKNGKTVLRFFRSKQYSDIQQGIPGWTKYGKNGAILYKQERFKNGGIIKAQRGVKTNVGKSYYSTVFQPNFAHILEGLGKENSADYANWLNGMQDKHYYLWNNIAGGDAKAYGDTAVKDIKVGEYQNDYKNGFNSEFNNDGKGYNTLGISNAVAQGRYDLSGSTRTSGDWGDQNWTTDSLFSSITDDRRLLGRQGDFTEDELASINEQLKARNYQMVLGENSYYYLKPLETTVKEELKKPQEERKKSIVDPIEEFNKPKGNSLSNTITQFAPTALSAIRYLGALRANNRVAKTIKDSISPVIKNTYELYSPVTGAFSTMQFKNNQAASLRRMLPFTSDGSLELARRFEANRQARQLETEGFLADDAEILRTKQEALKRQEDNKARRSIKADDNIANIAQANREKAQVEATRIKQNYDSTNNFLADIESRIRNNNEEKRQLAQTAALQGARGEYQQAYQNLSRIYREAHPNASTSDMLNDSNYVDAVRRLREQYNYRNYQIGTGKYRNPYANFIQQSYEDILNNISFGRRGGILKRK